MSSTTKNAVMTLDSSELDAILRADATKTVWAFRGRGALAHLLQRRGLKRGAKVGLQAFTCSAVPEGILAAGCQPIYIDINPGRLGMDVNCARATAADLDAIVVQHTYGIMADVEALSELAQSLGIPLIEDCCHTYFSTTASGVRAGSVGDAAFYSLEWGKPLVCGIGGIGKINRHELFQHEAPALRAPLTRARLQIEAQYVAFKMVYSPALYWNVKRAFHALSRLGIGRSNYTLADVGSDEAHSSPVTSEEFGWSTAPAVRRRAEAGAEAAVCSALHSQRIARIYSEALPANVQLPKIDFDRDVLVRFPLIVEDKESVLAFAEHNRIEASEWYRTPVHPYPAEAAAAVGYRAGSCPQAESMSKRIVTLPLNLNTSEAQVASIAASLSRYFQTRNQLRSDDA